MFRNPDWRFLGILFLCLIFLSGITFLLSQRELSQTASQQEIVQIQDRYARLVMNMPAKVIKKVKAKELPPPVTKKEEPVKKVETKIEEPVKEVETKIEEPEPVVEKKIEIIPKAPPLPEVEMKVKKVEEIKEPALELEPEREKKIDIPLMEAPEVNLDALSKYDMRDTGDAGIDIDADKGKDRLLTPRAPEIGLQASDKYKVKERAIEIDMTDQRRRKIDVDRKMPEVKSYMGNKYGATEDTRHGRTQSLDLSEKKTRSFNIASKAPDVGSGSSSRYGTVKGSQGGSSSGLEMGSRNADRRSMVSVPGKIPAVEPTARGRKYSGLPAGGAAASRPSPAVTAPAPERKVTKSTTRKATVVLPQTAGIQNLSACVDPTEESRLKGKILAAVSHEGFYCEDGLGEYEFLNIEMISTMEIRFKSRKAGAYNRCDALGMALQCLTNKSKR